MAEAAHQQSFNENNGDQQPDQGLDQVHNGVPYQVDDQTLDPSESQVNDHTIDQAQYELQNQLEYQQYQLQDQSQEQLQDQIEDQSQEQLQYQPQDQEDYQLHAQEQGDQGEDQVEYQVEGQPQDQIIDHVQDQVQVQGVPYETTESEQEQANVESVDEEAYGGEENRWPGWPGETVFRLLVPAQKVGSIIGHKGDIIKKIVEETRARIKILDGPPGTMERAVMISATEEPDLSLSPAMDGLLRVHMRVVDGLEGDSTHVPPAKVSTRLLVPAPQAGSLIGKQGATVKSIQEASSCIVRVLGTEALPIFALQDDRAVEVVGDPTSVHKALELIASHLRKFLVDRGIIPLFETQMQKPSRQMDHMPPHQPWGPPPQGLPLHAGGGPGYGHNPPPYMQQPPRHVDNYYPPEMHTPVMEKQPHQGISAYGREPAMGIHASSAPTQQVTQQMQIPLSYADAVIGTSGSNISYIRRISGATVTIQESRGAPGEMTVEISGAASQVLTAQQLVQNFMAEAGAPAPAPTQTAVSADQAYNMYAAHHNAVYASSATNPGHAAHPGGYGTDYGTGYGY